MFNYCLLQNVKGQYCFCVCVFDCYVNSYPMVYDMDIDFNNPLERNHLMYSYNRFGVLESPQFRMATTANQYF